MAKRKAKSKYKKVRLELWQCKGCTFEWAYKAFRCPLCASATLTKIL